jgi:hypothetical protein
MSDFKIEQDPYTGCFNVVSDDVTMQSISITQPGGVGNITLSNNYAYNTIANGTITAGKLSGTINIKSDGDRALIETTKHEIDVDKLYEDVKDLKQVLVALANDSDLLERNPIIRDILAEWLIKGLSK